MKKKEIVKQLEQLIDEGEKVLKTSHTIEGFIGGPFVQDDLFFPWRGQASLLLHEILPSSRHSLLEDLEQKNSGHTSHAQQWQAHLKATLAAVENGLFPIDDSTENTSLDSTIERLLSRFPETASSLNQRRGNRAGFDITDEYDVQDLLRSICLAYFEDVRDEEPVPSFAGKSSRVDIFLKNESRFIEVKMTRDGLGDKKLGEELSIDIPQYQEHPGCEKLFCFIYDPERRVHNATGLKNDLEKIAPDFVNVIIAR